MSLTTHTVEQIWNSAYMRNFRRAMLRGERIDACQSCYDNEAASGSSYRTMVGLDPLGDGPLSRNDMAKYGQSSGFRVEQRPGFVKLEISNLCNLKCRMCKAEYSSQIERDPVHNKWNGSDDGRRTGEIDPLHALWRGRTARIGPEPRIGIRSSGLHLQDFGDGKPAYWTDGHAIFNVPLQDRGLVTGVDVSFHPAGAKNQRFRILINGRSASSGITNEENSYAAINLIGWNLGSELNIEIISSTVREAEGERGVLIASIILNRQTSTLTQDSGPAEPVISRPGSDGPWYMDDHIIYDDILKSFDTLQRLYITGGEPFINDRVAEILDYLIDKKAAERIWLELSTNCTYVDARIIERLKEFRRLDLNLSIDGVSDTYEYIRYPAKWATIDANIKKLKDAFGKVCVVNPVVQAYNVLRLTDLYRYCDSLGLDVVESMLIWPQRLAVGTLPKTIRKAAAELIFKHCESEVSGVNKSSRLSLARHLNELDVAPNPDSFRELMVFTNDLDASRKQSFRSTHADFVGLLADDGIDWADDTLYANSDTRKRAARDLDYALV
jgi:hypothetical protein